MGREHVVKQREWVGLSERHVLPGPPQSPAKPEGEQSGENLVRLKQLELEMKGIELEEKKVKADLMREFGFKRRPRRPFA